MSKFVTYAHQAMAACGFAVLSPEVAATVRPDLFHSGMEASGSLGEANQHRHFHGMRGVTRLQAELAGLAHPTVTVITRSMDDLERRNLGERPVFWHQTQDLSSRFKFTPPVGSHLITGAAIAGHLRGLFRTYGAPLFFKRHNGGNLNSAEVNALFYEYLAIP